MHERADQILQHAFPGARVLSREALIGGVAAAPVRLDAVLADGSSVRVVAREFPGYCFKDDPEFGAVHFQILSELHGTGVKMPKPLAFSGRTEEFPNGYMVLEFVEGEVDFAGLAGRDFARGYAAELARIHRSQPKCGGVMRTQTPRPPDRGTPDAEFMEGEILDAIERASPPISDLVVCHGDIWPGNVIWRGDAIVAVIDWDDVKRGFALYDVACARLDLWFILGADVACEFSACYGALTGADMAALPYWTLRACLRLIRGFDAWPDVFPTVGRPDITRETLKTTICACASEAITALSLPGPTKQDMNSQSNTQNSTRPYAWEDFKRELEEARSNLGITDRVETEPLDPHGNSATYSIQFFPSRRKEDQIPPSAETSETDE